MQCVILAGGLGTRIKSVSGGLPKAILPVAGRPFAFHQLAWLRNQNVKNVLYCIGHKGDILRKTVGDGTDWGMKISYSDEGDALRGTGGAIRLAIDRGLVHDGFLVLYADSFLPIESQPVWTLSRHGESNVMVVIRNEGRWDKSNVVFENGMVRHYEKNLLDPAAAGMKFIDYGLSVLNRSTLAERIPSDRKFDLSDFYTKLSFDGLLLGYEVHDRFYEVGSPAGLADLEAHLSDANHT